MRPPRKPIRREHMPANEGTTKASFLSASESWNEPDSSGSAEWEHEAPMREPGPVSGGENSVSARQGGEDVPPGQGLRARRAARLGGKARRTMRPSSSVDCADVSPDEVVEAEIIDDLVKVEADTHHGRMPNQPIEMGERRKEREDERKRVIRRRLVRVCGAVMTCAIFVWLVAFSPLFAYRLSKTSVAGANNVVTQEMVKTTLGGYEGVPLPRLDVESMEEALLRAHPALSRAEISRAWLHGVKVTIETRTAIASVMLDGKVMAVDSQGVIYDVSESALEGLSRIEIDDKSQESNVAVSLLRSLDADTLTLVSRISVTSTEQVTITLSQGAVVKWGDTSENALKAQVLRVLLANVQAHTYDVSVPKSPVTSP